MTTHWPQQRNDPMDEALDALIAARQEHERALARIEADEVQDITTRRRGHVAEPQD